MQYRDKAEIKIEPDEGHDTRGAIQKFKIQRVTSKESRRSERERWALDTSATPYVTHEDIATGLTRGQLAKLVADAADWLSYIEED